MTQSMPSLIDAHHHVWDLAARPQPWMNGTEMAPLRRNFGVDDLAVAVAGQHIAGTVVVQTVADYVETEDLLDLAEQQSLIAGVVGYVDVAAADVGDQLDRLLNRPSGRWLVGIRSLVQYESDPNWLSRSQVLDGLQAVAAHDLVHDLLILPHQIEAAAEAITAVPTGRFVVDHLAKPHIATDSWQPWADNFAVLAHCPNVSAKLSGLVTEADWASWTVDDLRPYVDHALGAFGPHRLMFGSDWPVCTLAATYDQVVTATTQLTSALSTDEQLAVFGGTATTVYSLTDRIAASNSHQEPS
jgi:L-fuconolactonase